jgi:hypothetical protein
MFFVHSHCEERNNFSFIKVHKEAKIQRYDSYFTVLCLDRNENHTLKGDFKSMV